MIRRPPRSTLFPYHDALPILLSPVDHHMPLNGCDRNLDAAERSEEHTSELQSRLHLVCRLLLEKKKKQKPTLLDRLRIIRSSFLLFLTLPPRRTQLWL